MAKLQARVNQLYLEGAKENHEKIQEIARRARSPGGGLIDGCIHIWII